jgi:hypothetical protein
VWEYVRSLIGEATTHELVLVGVLFLIIRMYTWAPWLGERIGAFFEEGEE